MIATKQSQRTNQYILKPDGTVVPEPRLLVWGAWMQSENHLRIVRKTQVGNVEVSTVFLGLDHNFVPGGQPILFETMCFRGDPREPIDGEGLFARYATRQDAIAGHERIVNAVQQAETPE